MKYPSFSRMSARLGFTLAALVGAGAYAAACSNGEAREDFADAGVDAGPAPVVDSGPSITGDSGRAPFDPDANACESAAFEAKPVPLTLVVLLDRSGSMQMGGTDHWTPSTNAIRAFVDRSEVIGMELGLAYFPAKSGPENDIASYANLAVGIDTLPENVLPVMNSLASTTPTGGTPMAAGLEGTISAMRKYIKQTGPRAGGIVLVTDGEPNGGVDGVVTAAHGGANPPTGEPRISTFAVGMQGASFSTLNKIAVAGGGSETAFDVGQGAEMQQALLGALDTIRTGAIGCEYELPKPERGRLDTNSVEVRFTPGLNDPQATFRQVANLAACGATTGGFYYDDPAEPKQILLCPASCDAVSAGTPNAKVDIYLGCIFDTN